MVDLRCRMACQKIRLITITKMAAIDTPNGVPLYHLSDFVVKCVGVGVGVVVGVYVGVGVGVGVDADVGVGVGVDADVDVGVGVSVEVDIGV